MKADFAIGSWLVQPDVGRIVGEDGEVRVEPKVMDVLVFLASRPGEVLSKERIIQNVWADTFVGDDVLTHAISQLRRAFRDDPKEPRVIETIPRRGYRLIAPVSFPDGSPNADPDASKTASGSRPFAPLQATVGRPRFLRRIFALSALSTVVAAYIFWPDRETADVLQLTNPVLLTTAAGIKDYPTWRPDGSEIAYQSNQSGKWDIWVTQVRGRRSVNLTADHTGDDLYPSWSPDGSQIAFWSSREGGGEFVMPALGGRPRKLASSGAALSLRRPGPAQWSRDGTELAFARQDPGGGHHFVVEILSVERGTSRRVPLPERIEPHRQGWELCWSPDGRFFAYATAGDWASPVSQLWVFGLADMTPVPLTPAREHLEWSPTWSPEGHLYFVSNRGGSMDLWRQRLDENARARGSPERLTTGVDMRYAVFSPDQKRLAYSRTQPRQHVWRVPVFEDRPTTWSDARQLTFEQVEVANLELSPDGKTLAFTLFRHGQRHVWLLPSEGGELVRLLADPMAQVFPRWSPDGREIAFHSIERDKRNIWVAPIGGGPARNLTQADEKVEAPDFLMPIWSPQGDQILSRSQQTGGYWSLWVISPTGQKRRRLTHPESIGSVVSINPWSPDGREIVFGYPDLRIVSAEGGEPRQLTDHPAWGAWPNWSPDGRWIVFNSDRSGDRRPWKVRPSGGEPEPVTDSGSSVPIGVGPELGARWSPDGSSIFFAAERDGLRNVYVVPADGGAERQVTDFRGKRGHLQAFQTDGRHLYFTWDESGGEIWVMDVVR